MCTRTDQVKRTQRNKKRNCISITMAIDPSDNLYPIALLMYVRGTVVVGGVVYTGGGYVSKKCNVLIVFLEDANVMSRSCHSLTLFFNMQR